MSTSTINKIFPLLQILPVEKLLLHERLDKIRTFSLIKRLNSDGVLRNPPVVIPMKDPQGHYVVLDGANRISAFQKMRIPHILTQVVSVGEPGLDLKTWNQVILGITPEQLLTKIRNIPGLNIVRGRRKGLLSDIEERQTVIRIHLPIGDIYTAFGPTSFLKSRVNLLNLIMEKVRESTRIDRTHLQTIESLTNLYPDLAGLIVFPRIKIDEIIHLASARQMIPAGITRFIISPRALRLNYPISDLKDDKSLIVKNERLHTWIKARVTQKGIRSYEEITYLFDE